MSNHRRRALPPQMLDGGKVVCFAHLDERVRPTGNTVHMLAGGVFPPFRGLAVIEEATGGPYYLLYCDKDWHSLTDTWHETLDQAKAQAEFEFEGISRSWRTLLSEA
jgi:hypothetical protein